jgi:hypothetical protein
VTIAPEADRYSPHCLYCGQSFPLAATSVALTSQSHIFYVHVYAEKFGYDADEIKKMKEKKPEADVVTVSRRRDRRDHAWLR